MKKALFLFSSLFILICGVYGQSNFAPLGAYWNYDYEGHNGGFSSHWSIRVTKDTLLNGFETKTLTRYFEDWYVMPPYQSSPSPQPFGTLQVRHDSVFYYDSFGYNGTFLFSFKMKAGDTIPIMPNRLYAVVDTSFMVTINGVQLKQWTLQKYCDGGTFGRPVNIVENIGQIDDFLLWNKDGCQIGGGGCLFKCYNSSNISYNQPCEPVGLGRQLGDPESASFFTFPNPMGNVLNLTLSAPLNNVELSIININGQVVLKNTYNRMDTETINTAIFPAGLYMVQLKTKEFSIRKMLIKD